MEGSYYPVNEWMIPAEKVSCNYEEDTYPFHYVERPVSFHKLSAIRDVAFCGVISMYNPCRISYNYGM